jgi:hypothetical protein
MRSTVIQCLYITIEVDKIEHLHKMGRVINVISSPEQQIVLFHQQLL